MIRLAVIGTNWISDRFVAAALKSGEYTLFAVYSRKLASAKQFGQKYAANYYFDCLESLAASAEVDAVYIASPNSLHASQAMIMMRGGKHVMVEKPMASNVRQVEQMFEVAKAHNVVLFEAYMAPFTPNFQVAKQAVESIGTVRLAHLSYCQYSSRYQKYLDGENPNTFNPEFSNGSIMDIGYYCVGAAVELFGAPDTIHASAHRLDSGVDGSGNVILSYPQFNVVLSHSKTCDAQTPSEIQGESGSVLIEMVSFGRRVERIRRGGEREDLTVAQDDNPMLYEAQVFAHQVTNNKMTTEYIERSLLVARVITDIRHQTGVIFPADSQ
ncbi:Gfo/Idh/MocA family protein [Vibrio sp. WXL103]|uniref:Gfo/Idh/MocA family protein n=1 Tax=Vibrio sp. WXL103 TaxID=3450710 RepID=UPI003EC784E9